MRLAFDPRQHTLNVIKATDQAGAEVEAGRTEWLRGRRFVEDRKTGAKSVVHDDLERQFPAACRLFEPSRHVLFQGQCGSHIVMLLD